MRHGLLLIFFGCLVSTGLHATTDAPFDLSGPKVDVRVRRGDVTLPISQVPNLIAGDRLWIHPDFPDSQSEHYLLIVAFLRGVTNPPPPEWFTRVDTWTRAAREEGVYVVVPAEAQQALIFLAPETSGGWNTLRSAVHNKPGVFVRSVQDLQAASLDRMRLDAYLAEVKSTAQTDPALLKDRIEKTARSLGIRLDQQCFDKPSEQQAPCLVQHTEGLVLDDANVQSRVEQLAKGSTTDLMNQISSSPMGGAGVYSAYVGAVVDTAKILGSLHTAHFQYIPALALPAKDTLNLRLNVPPSFRDPKSVIVIGLPRVGPVKPPTPRAGGSADSYCAQKPGLVLPIEGAPPVFATQQAHDLVLHLEPLGDLKAAPVDVPAQTDAALGGIVLDRANISLPEGEWSGVLRGKWGFDDWDGPRFHLRTSQAGNLAVAAVDQSALVVGRDDTLHLTDESALCVERVEARTAGGSSFKLLWTSTKPGMLEAVVPLKDAAPGLVTLDAFQFGHEKPDELVLKAYAEAASLDRLTLSVGDTDAFLKGTRLDEVASAEFDGITWTPAELKRVADFDQLRLIPGSSTASLDPAKRHTAAVKLQDGRQLKVAVTVEPPRPQVVLLSKGAQDDPAAAPSPVHLGSTEDLPVDRRLIFFLKSRVPAAFPRDQKVEVAAVDGGFRTMLSLADGSLMLADATTALGVVEPLARFGSSAFGPLRARAMSANGVPGDWLKLGTLVRLPGFKELRCPHLLAKPCLLTGTNLFLATAIAATPEFENAAEVPEEFTGTQLSVPHPANGLLYVKLRDDPETVQTLALPVVPISVAAAQTQAVEITPMAAAKTAP